MTSFHQQTVTALLIGVGYPKANDFERDDRCRFPVGDTPFS
jgi:hypothetical protein